MSARITTIVLSVALVLSVLLVAGQARQVRLPGNHQGYEPAQPIAFSHRQHAGELAMDCQYCHIGAETSRYAGIPATDSCMACHQFVTAPLGAAAEGEEGPAGARVVSRELQTLYDALALDEDLRPSGDRQPVPLAWTRVHVLPDYVYFDHRAHVTAGVTCQTCHGPVETMDRMRQYATLSMGWCVDCHRETNETGVAGRPTYASLDCVACHY